MSGRSIAVASSHDPSPQRPSARRLAVAGEAATTNRHALEAHLFGRFRVEREGRPLRGLPHGKSQELLAYLLVHRDRAHRREAVSDLLWGDGPASDPRKTMRQALWQLQSALAGGPPLVESLGGDWIGIRPGADLWVDLGAFEAAWREIEGASGGALPAAVADRARRVVELCQGELLEGCDWGWCRFERERLCDLFAAMVDEVMAWCEASGAHATGIRLGSDLLRLDRAREQTHRSLMRLHALAGDRTGALRQYERCAEALREELAVPPGRATRELLVRIREDAPLAPDPSPRRRRDGAETRRPYNGLSASHP